MGEKSTNVLEQYDFQVMRTSRGRGAVFCETNQGLKLLKEYNGSSQRLDVEDGILNHIRANGGICDSYVRNKAGRVLSIDSDGSKYVVKNWFDGRECDVRSQSEILAAVKALAGLHKRMVLCPQEGSVDQFYAPPLTDLLNRHHTELKRVRSFIRKKQKKTEFELQVLGSFDEFYDQGSQALSMLEASSYTALREKALTEGQFCHGNYNQHNILATGRNLVVTNFDKFCIDLQLMDLYLFMRKIMEKHSWDPYLGAQMYHTYEKEKGISKEETKVLTILFLYPEKFWKLVNHYYNNNKAWIPQKDIEKLETVIRQNESKKEFLSYLQ